MNLNKFIKPVLTTTNHLIKLVSGGFFTKRSPNRVPIQTVLYILSVMCLLSAVFSASGSTYSDVLAGGFLQSTYQFQTFFHQQILESQTDNPKSWY